MSKTKKSENGALYYVQDSRQYVGNCVLWWCPEGKGYTTQLDEAGLYNEEQVKGMRPTDVPWPKEVVESAVARHVRIERLRDAANRVRKAVEEALKSRSPSAAKGGEG